VKFTVKLLFLLIFVVSSCARKGRPEGGPKDKDAPILVTAEPPYETTHFSKDKIKIYFNEYIVLKKLNKQLVVSPPMKNPPIITPQGTPSKYITIKILDTLQENTTYIFNFGNAVQDNNEGNKIESFKYVFSTGNYIDSLMSKGKIKDALLRKPDKNINVLLYRIDSSFTDSIIYKKKPNYVANTLDSTVYQFSNVKAGKYFLIALKEDANDYLFNPKTEKIGFLSTPITLPKDSIIKTPIVLFKEELPYQFKRGKEVAKGKIIFSFDGKIDDLKIKPLSDVPNTFKSAYRKEQDKDTINYWFTPFKADSLNFIVSTKTQIDTVTVKLRKKKIDSLIFNPSTGGVLHLKDTFFITTNNPILQPIDTSKITLIDKDTLVVKGTSFLLKNPNKLALLFDKKQNQSYQLTILPKAISDIYSQQNDTLQYRFKTKKIEDYGKLILTIENPESKHLIVELLTERKKMVAKKFLSTTKTITFDKLKPKKYIIRVIIDTNNNKKWDTGNYLKKIQPETIIYYPEELKIRANWDVNETFTIKKG